MRSTPSTSASSARAKLSRANPGAPNASPGTIATCACSRISSHSSSVLVGVPPGELATEHALERGEAVERTLRFETGDARDRGEQLVHHPTATVERGAHLRDRVEVARHRGQRGALAHVGHVRRLVRLEVDRRRGEVGRADHPPDAPPGHRVRLGDAVEHDTRVGDLGDDDRHAS